MSESFDAPRSDREHRRMAPDRNADVSSTLLAMLASIVSVHVALQNTALVATLCLGAVVASLAARKPKSAGVVLFVSLSEKVSTIGRVTAVCVLAWGVVPMINPWFLSVPLHWYYRGQATWSTLPPLPPALVHCYDSLIQKTAEPDPNAALYTSIEKTLRAGVQPQTAPTGDYVHAWTLQLGAWLTAHDVTVAPVDVGLRRTVSVYEDATLYKLSGWPQ